MELPAIMKQLRGLLGELAGRVAGRNKDDVTEALSLVPLHTSLHFVMLLRPCMA
jgi:hypothetical protein